jgi:hypothetical protein
MLSVTFSGCGLIMLPAYFTLVWLKINRRKSAFHCAEICFIMSIVREFAMLLGAFAKLRKETTGFVVPACLSICPFVHPHGTTRLLLDRFS